VAISSASFQARLGAAELTQLEWLESCASQLGADGVVFEQAHFARTDAEYVAQVKKVSVDLGLVPVAVSTPSLFDSTVAEADRLTAIDLAAGLGALFVLAELPEPGAVPPATFVATVSAAKAAVKAAKRVNVTLLARTAPGTLAEDAGSLRHFLKDVDSAWLRFALPAGADRTALGTRDRILLVTLEPGADPTRVIEIEDSARPWLLLAGDVDATRVAAVRAAAARVRLAAGAV
jgi:hypothetical protein